MFWGMASTFALSDRLGRRVLIAAILASSMAFIDSTALNVALPALQNDLGASGADLLWIVNAYLLLLGALMLLGGSLGDHLGRKRMFGAGIALFAGGSLVSGLAPNTTILIGARVVQGAGGALMVPGSLALITASLSPQDRGKAIGLWSSVTTVTTIGGPILGGFFADQGLWRAVFFINLPLAVVALYELLPVPENRDESAAHALDFSGAALTVVGLAGITYGLITLGNRGIQAGLRDPLTVLGLIAGAAALVLLVWVESRSDHPMVDLALFRSRTFSGTNLMTAFLYGALSGGLLFLPLNLIQVQGYRASVAGFTLIPFSVLLALLSPWAGGVVDRRGPRLLLTAGPLLVGAGFVALARPGLTHGPGDYWTTYLPGILIMGLGMGLTVAPLTTTVMGSVSSDHAGVASGINNAVSRQAGVVAIAVFGAVSLVSFSHALDSNTAHMSLTSAQQVALHDQASNLGDAKPPDGLDPNTAAAVAHAIDRSFVDTFRVIALIAAGLCFVSAVLAALLVEQRTSTASEAG
jgi:EmrB/QacA subfamily drug resistance transporter